MLNYAIGCGHPEIIRSIQESRKEIARIVYMHHEKTALQAAKSYYKKTLGAKKARYLQIVEYLY